MDPLDQMGVGDVWGRMGPPHGRVGGQPPPPVPGPTQRPIDVERCCYAIEPAWLPQGLQVLQKFFRVVFISAALV